ncbi:MAG: hypothetical protein MR332_09230 [Fusicatenibacter sp.]|nr:hypothetical protein [Fusicatenibacter sp.]
MDLAGIWKVRMPDGSLYEAKFPGTLDTNGIGEKDKERLDNRLTRKHTFEGAAGLLRTIRIGELEQDKRSFFEVERARCLSLKCDGRECPEMGKGTLSTPYVFEVTDCVKKASLEGKEELELEVISDNSYPGLPQLGILTSSAATDETQTNWNGMLGFLRIRQKKQVFIDDVCLYPRGEFVDAHLVMDAGEDYTGELFLSCEAFDGEKTCRVSLRKGERKTFEIKEMSLKKDVKRWDEEEGNLYQVRIGGKNLEEKNVWFGVRDFGVSQRMRLTINKREFFLRGEANCAVFPETGYAPMEEERWTKILKTYASYGVNCMRFHSWCPPEAAFAAADRLGMMMQPELSHWDYQNAFGTEESYDYYKKELTQILRELANHPSFVMLSFGNELWSEEIGEERKEELLDYARKLDSTRLYAGSSNGHYGQWGTDVKSDFYTSHNYKEFFLRGAGANMEGHINQAYPNTRTNFDEGVRKIQEEGKPVFGFEVGQFEVLPEFDEIEKFQGVTQPVNYEMMRENAKERGELENWKEWVEATGEIALLGYREEIESVLRTEGMSGLSLLGLQDFPGQGTALVGMIDSHLDPKPHAFARPERFRAFFSPVVPLVLLDKYTYWNTEKLTAEILLANYGKSALRTAISWQIFRGSDQVVEGCFRETEYENQGLRKVGKIEQDLCLFEKAEQLRLVVTAGDYQNEYPIWVYPELERIAGMEREETYEFTDLQGTNIRIASVLDEDVKQYLRDGGIVYLEPKPLAENLPSSIGGQFTTDFWSVGTFPDQEGGMGMIIRTEHPIFRNFPTENHTNWQWWQMTCGRPLILPKQIKPILTVADSGKRLKHMGLLFEAKVGNGTVMVSGMELRFALQYPETRTLFHNILCYLGSQECHPSQELSVEELQKLVRNKEKESDIPVKK